MILFVGIASSSWPPQVDTERMAMAVESNIVRVTFHGLKFSMHVLPPSEDGVSREIQSNGAWQPEISKRLLKALDRRAGTPSLLVDVGANLGWFALLALSAGHRVIALEANPRNVQLLNRSAALNGFGPPRLQIIEGAVGSARSACALVSEETNQADTMLACSDGELEKLRRAHAYRVRAVVPVSPLDDYLRMQPRARVLKIDVEGYEPSALSASGAGRLFSRSVETLFTEFSPWASRAQGLDPENFLGSLVQWRFACVDAATGSDQVLQKATRILRKPRNRREQMKQFDLQCTRNLTDPIT